MAAGSSGPNPTTKNAHLAYGLIAPNDFAVGSTDYTSVEMWAG